MSSCLGCGTQVPAGEVRCAVCQQTADDLLAYAASLRIDAEEVDRRWSRSVLDATERSALSTLLEEAASLIEDRLIDPMDNSLIRLAS